MPDEMAIKYLNASLMHREELIEEVRRNVWAYRSGRLIDPYGNESNILPQDVKDYLRLNLIEKFNRKMADKVKRNMEMKPECKSYFFAFGALHFIGHENIIELLRAEGFHLEQVSLIDDLGLESRFYSSSGNDKLNIMLFIFAMMFNMYK